jgi:hypothetical protein
MRFLCPHIRLELLIRTMLTREWDDEAWPMVREEFKEAMALRSRLRRAGGTNPQGVSRSRPRRRKFSASARALEAGLRIHQRGLKRVPRGRWAVC